MGACAAAAAPTRTRSGGRRPARGRASEPVLCTRAMRHVRDEVDAQGATFLRTRRADCRVSNRSRSDRSDCRIRRPRRRSRTDSKERQVPDIPGERARAGRGSRACVRFESAARGPRASEHRGRAIDSDRGHRPGEGDRYPSGYHPSSKTGPRTPPAIDAKGDVAPAERARSLQS